MSYEAIPILHKHIQFLIDRHAWLAALDEKPEEFGELFSTEWTRASMTLVVAKGANHLKQVGIYTSVGVSCDVTDSFVL